MPTKTRTTGNAAKKTVKAPSQKTVTEKQVWDVMEFAKDLYGGMYPNVFTPQLVNSRMSDISMNPNIPSSESIDKALQSPNANQDLLVGYSEFFELTNSMYKRSMKYLSTLLAFDLSYECINTNPIIDVKTMKSSAYKKDMAIAEEFLRRFNYKEEFPKIMNELLRRETFYGVFRDDGNKYTFQELPRKYSLITGKTSYGLSYDFNMLWFIQPGVDIGMYPAVFKDYYNRVFTGDTIPKYIPSAPSSQHDGSWTYWVQTTQEEGMWAFKFTPEISANIPYLSSSFGDLVLQPLMRQLQTNQNIIAATKLILGEIPYLKDSKGAVVANQLAATPDLLGKFLHLMQSGMTDLIKLGGMPMAEIEAIDFKGDNEVYSSYNRNTAGQTGLNSSFLYSSDKKNAVEAQIAMNVDENVVKHMYEQFANFINFEINRRTKTYKFNFSFEGFNIYLDRNERYGNTIKMAQMGFVDMNRMGHILGTDAFGLKKRLMASQAEDITSFLTILPNVNTQFGGASGGDATGRPMMDDSQLSESGSETRLGGGNENR